MNPPLPSRAPVRDSAALGFVLLFPLLMAWVYFVLMAGEGQRANPAFIAGYALGKFIQFAFPALYVFCFERSSLGPGKLTARGLGWGAAFGLAVAAVFFALYFGWLVDSPGVAGMAPRIREKLREFGRETPLGFLQVALFLSVVHSLFEEYYWRWFAFGWLKRYLPVAAAIVLSALGFMAHHVVILGVYLPGRFWTMAVPMSLCIAVGGMFWAWLYHRSGSLLGPWLSHALVDAALMAVGYFMLWPPA